MRILGTIVGLALASSSTMAAAGADYYLQIKGVGRDFAAGPIYLQATAGDLDGDGLADAAIIRLVCADGALSAIEYNVQSPRDVASGQASGKRTHKPVTFVKEWGPATPQLRAMKPTYDVKKVEGTGAKTMSEDSWKQMTLANADGLCTAAEAAVKAHKTRSNIQNN